MTLEPTLLHRRAAGVAGFAGRRTRLASAHLIEGDDAHIDRYTVDSVIHFVLPHTDDQPSVLCQCVVGTSVTSDVRLELWAPVVDVAAGNRAVVGTAVPEAAVDEHGDS